MAAYVAVIRRTPGTDFWIDIPDVPGCVSRGETPEAAKANIGEALALHLADGSKPLAPPRTADQLTREELEDAVETCVIEL